jgi:MFS superfamily sulfate permease-like transporter
MDQSGSNCRGRADFLITAPLYFASGLFDRAEPEIVIAALIILAVAVICFRRNWTSALNAMLAAGFVLINFAAWLVWTEQLKRYAAVGDLYPHTRLNNTLYRAEPWHLLVLLWALVMFGWAARLLFKETKSKSGT